MKHRVPHRAGGADSPGPGAGAGEKASEGGGGEAGERQADGGGRQGRAEQTGRRPAEDTGATGEARLWRYSCSGSM